MNYKRYTFNLSEVYDDKVYKSKVINSVLNSIIIFSIIFMIIAYVATAFGIKELNEDITLFNSLCKFCDFYILNNVYKYWILYYTQIFYFNYKLITFSTISKSSILLIPKHFLPKSFIEAPR